MNPFKRHELPLVYTLVLAAKRVKPQRDGRHPYQQYFLYWTAFDTIYTTLARRHGVRTVLVRDEAGDILTARNGSLRIPVVEVPGEDELLRLALMEFSEDLKHDLIRHKGTDFFANRIPFWDGVPIETDGFGQRVNGVINVNSTTDRQYPVWSPVDLPAYADYLADPVPGENRELLARQILDLLHTIRRNFMFGGRVMDDAVDIRVVEHGLPMLERIVGAFLQ